MTYPYITCPCNPFSHVGSWQCPHNNDTHGLFRQEDAGLPTTVANKQQQTDHPLPERFKTEY